MTRIWARLLLLVLVVSAGIAGWLLATADHGGNLPRLPAPKAHRSVIRRDTHLRDPERMEQRLMTAAAYLASDDLGGRGLGSTGLEQAAQYLARQFDEIGLKTDLYDGQPFQTFYLSRRLALGEGNELKLIGPGPTRLLKLGEDFTPVSLSSSGTFDLPLAFAGYGITADDLGYDDYADLDVRGKAVVILRHEPQRGNANSVFNGTQNSEHAFLVRKLANAVGHGAAAVIFCTDQYELNSRSGRQPDSSEKGADLDQLMSFRVRAVPPSRRIPVLHCRRWVVDQILKAANKPSLQQWEQGMERELSPQSFPLTDWRLAGQVALTLQGDPLRNVIGVLEGRGPSAEETLVIGAHYDHLGRGGLGTLAPWTVDIHNGADDNASGTSVLLEVARQMAGHRDQLARRVVFVAFSAEESGLIGSSRYVRQPLVPLSQTVAMINLDMVGRLTNNRLTVYGTGTAAEFDPLIDRLGAKHQFQLVKRAGGSGPSDHASFYARRIPVLHFFTGLHRDYHRPSDDVEKLNIQGMRRIAQLVTELTLELASAPQRPQPVRPRRRQSSGDSGQPSGNQQQPKAADRPLLGIALQQDAQPNQYVVARLVEGGPAQQAGMRVGDVVVRFAGRTLQQNGDLAATLQQQQPGDTVEVVVRRGTTELELRVRLPGP